MQSEYGKGWLDGVHPDDLTRCLESYSRAFDAQRPFSTEFRLRHADGTYHWLLDIGKPRYTTNGELVGYIGSSTDVTVGKDDPRDLAERTEKMAESITRAATGASWSLRMGGLPPIKLRSA
jgi:hypothetical protein